MSEKATKKTTVKAEKKETVKKADVVEKKSEPKTEAPVEKKNEPKPEAPEFMKFFNKWEGITEWMAIAEKKNYPKDEWKAKLIDYVKEVLSKMNTMNPEVAKTFTQDNYFDIFKECMRRVHQKYVMKTRPTTYISKAKTGDYYIYLIGTSNYFDWGLPKYQAALDKYAQAASSERALMEQRKEILIKRNSQGKFLSASPTMKWGKARIEIPQHAYLRTDWGVAIPVESFKRAMEEGAESNAWNDLKPVQIDFGSDSNKNIHFGDEKAKEYLNPMMFKSYKMSCFEDRGKRIAPPKEATSDEKFEPYFSHEGEVKTEEMELEDGTIKKVELFNGPRAYMYFLKPLKDHNLEPAPEFMFEDMDNYIIKEILYKTWNAVLDLDKDKKGLMCVPEVFESLKVEGKNERLTSMHPLAFEADVLDTFESEPKDEDDLTKFVPFRRFRLDDMLESKMPSDSTFLDVSMSLVSNMPNLKEKFDQVAATSRIRVIAELSKTKEEEPLGGRIIWFEVIQDKAVDKEKFGGVDVFNLDESPDEDIEEPKQ